MADIFKVIHPAKYFSDYVLNDTRIDGRHHDLARDVTINVRALKNAEASAGIKIGNTTVVCGIKLELAQPKGEEPDKGFLVINAEMSALCSQKIKPGPPNDFAQFTNNLISDIILSAKCFDLKDLCIERDKLCWVVYCDMVCIDNDGSVVDAFVIAAMAALKTLLMPTVTYNNETEKCEVNPKNRTPFKVTGLPLCTSFNAYNENIMLTDPTSLEESLCGGGTNTVISWNQGFLNGMYKFGGVPLTEEQIEKAMKISKNHAVVVEEAIETAIKNNCNHNKHIYNYEFLLLCTMS